MEKTICGTCGHAVTDEEKAKSARCIRCDCYYIINRNTPQKEPSCNEGMLKPCPFCGKIPTLSKSHFRYSITHECNAIRSVVGWGKKDEIMEAWNKRI